MKRLKFMWDYGNSVWLEADDGCFYPKLPPELKDDAKIVSLLDEVNTGRMALFLNTTTEFGWKGFDSEEHRLRFIGKARALIEMLKAKTAGRYEFIEEDTPEDMTMGGGLF